MIRRKKESIEWLEFEQLQGFKEIVHGVFLRHGGVSKPPYGFLNFGGGTNDDPNAIAENRNKVAQVLDLPHLQASHQVHKNDVAVISEKTELMCDGLITDRSNLGLLIKHADCQAAIFFDPIHKVIGNVHCGWRGNVCNIYQKTVQLFREKFNSHPQDLLVCISPSLGPSRSEFVNYQIELPTHFFPHRISETYFNLWEISKMQLLEEGVLESHIEIAKICTYLQEDDFFSYRREKKTGRHGTVVGLK